MTDRWIEVLPLRRAVFIFGNIATLVGLSWLIGGPLLTLFGDRATQIYEQRALLARLNVIAAQAATVEELAGRADMNKGGIEFLLGTNEGVIVANLQGQLKQMVQSAGAQLRSVHTLPVRADSGVRFTGAHVDVRGPIRAIKRAVQSVEAARPFLFIVNATLKPSARIARQSAAGATEPTIDAQLDIVGAIQSEGAN